MNRGSGSGVKGLRVSAVEPNSPADRAGVRPGDVIRAVNGQVPADELDFRYRASEDAVALTVERGDTEMPALTMLTRGEPPGMSFEELLADGVHRCNNRCVFCFIHQMPSRMRRSLYIMDDDFRLSFVHGNYITLTNLTAAERTRVMAQRLSPLYVSVHASDPTVRGRLLGSAVAEPVIPILTELAAARIDVHAQVVLCPGLNDGSVLERTLADLAALHPSASGMKSGVLSVAIVPVGLTRHRERLAKLTPPDDRYAAAILRWHRRRGSEMRRTLGTRFVWLSDEWYYLAHVRVPSRRHYEGFPQLDDGVGTTRLFLDDLERTRRRLPKRSERSITGRLVTGELAQEVVGDLRDALNAVDGVQLGLVVVPNRWFGGTISVAGLLTGADIAEALVRTRVRGKVWLPDVCLSKEGGVFLDDVTLGDLEARTRCEVEAVHPFPSAVASAMGLTRETAMR